jgi:hypothetical protein
MDLDVPSISDAAWQNLRRRHVILLLQESGGVDTARRDALNLPSAIPQSAIS